MDNEVVIHVRVRNEGKAGFEAIGKDADTQARSIGTSFSERISQTIRQTLTARLQGQLLSAGGPADVVGRSLGDRIGDTVATRISERVSVRMRDSSNRLFNGSDGGRGGEGGKGGDAKVNVEVDVDKQSLLSKMFASGKEGAASFADGFKGAIGTVMSGVMSGDVVSMVVKGIGLTSMAAGLAPIVGSAITTAVGLALGGGVLAAGIAAAFQDRRIQVAANNMMAQVKTIFSNFGDNFKNPILHFFIGGDDNGGGGLVGVLRQVQPMIDNLGKTFGPVAEKLASGLIGMLQNMLPGLLRAMEASAPIINTLSEKLPKIGDAMGRFFDHIADGSPEASIFFADLLDLVGLAIRVIGTLVEMFTLAYADLRRFFAALINWMGEALHAAATAFSWIPGLGPKLAAADGKFREFRDKVNNNLNGIDKNMTITVRFRVLGIAAATAALNTARILHNLGHAHGGIVGAATGGLHGGMRMVGEHGPELLELPPGTRVNSNPDTERLLAGQGGMPQVITVPVYLDGLKIAQATVEPMRELVRSQGRGSVQGYLGQPGMA